MAGHRISLGQQYDSRDEETNLASRRLKRISRSEKFIYEEKGAKDLYVGWPFIKGKLSDGTLIRCPLLFFPVDLELANGKWMLMPRPEEGTILNKSFLLAYAHFNKVKLGDDFIDRNFEDFDADSTVFRTSLYQVLKESDVELNFNQDNFQDKLQKFEEYKKSEFEEKYGIGELKLFPEAVLGIFPQAGSYLVPDYTTLIESNTVRDIEEFFISGKESEERPKYSFLDSVEEEKTFTPFKMDAHQENALKAIKKGNSIVVQGPPGTGKSQLICNLISDHLATGKKVLVVSQKRAALDVVHNRMKEKEMTPFLGLVHDFRNDRKSLFENIARQIDRIEEYKMLNNGLDTIQLERKFTQVSRRIDQLSEELEEFKFALFDESECGVSVKELYLTSNQNAEAVNFKQEYSQFKLNELDQFLLNLRDYVEYTEKYGRSDYEWSDRRSFKDHGVSDLRRLNEILEEIPAYQDEIAERALNIVGSKLTLDDFEFILNKRDYIVQMLGTLKDPKAYEYFQHLSNFTDTETSALWVSNIERVVMECYKGEGPETSLPSEQLGKFQETLQRNMNAKKNIFRLIKWSLFSKDKYWIKRVLVENGLKQNKEGFNTLVERIDNRLNLEHNLTKMKTRTWITGAPSSYEKVHFQTWFHLFKLTIKAKLIFNSLRNFKQYFNTQKLTYEELKSKIEQLFEIIKETPIRKETWLIYLTENQILNIENNPEMAEVMRKSLKSDFEDLCEFDRVKDQLSASEIKAINKLMQEANVVGVVGVKQIEQVFQNSIRLAWIEHIETKYPILRSVSSRKFHKMEAELQNAVKEKLSVTNDMLLLRAREKTYINAEHNRLNNMVTYRDLYHQVTKKRRIWPLRKLIANHFNELSDLIPCWLASPESVSAIFPMREMFDLVIFDEASQCFAERGIPAMYRGRKVLIAGDNRQLRPSDLYQVRFDDESDLPELEVDSLLELAGRYLMNVQLNGHYRSRSLDLIDFSNKHFYEGKLKLLPDFDVVNSNKPGIEYIKVDGIWDNNTNDIEADKVVELLLKIAGSSDANDVGVVTFNAKQQQYILDKIDEKFIEAGIVWPEGWFVKNIENVQGDEKDIIIFSTAYAPDSKGKMIMQFGSLNASGGENRLNVAVTRARQKVIIVSSIMPQQLKVEDAKNEGPKLLKKYLEYAYQVSEGKFKPTIPDNKNHSADWYLKTRLMNWLNDHSENFEVTEELPFADLTVKQKKQYKALLVTDDDLYYQSPSIKDIHVYTPFTLSKKHWRFRGFFSREWWSHREQMEETILRFVEGS